MNQEDTMQQLAELIGRALAKRWLRQRGRERSNVDDSTVPKHTAAATSRRQAARDTAELHQTS